MKLDGGTRVPALCIGIALAAGCLAGAAQEASLPQPELPPVVAGTLEAVIHEVVPRDERTFYLNSKDPYQPAFLHDMKGGKITTVACELAHKFEIGARATEQGAIAIAVCKREAKRVRALARSTGPSTLREFESILPPGNTTWKRPPDWEVVRTRSGRGEEFHFFPQIAFGHGILAIYTAVLVTPGAERAIVVQAQTYPLCTHQAFQANPLCARIRPTLEAMARRVAARDPSH